MIKEKMLEILVLEIILKEKYISNTDKLEKRLKVLLDEFLESYISDYISKEN